MYRELLPPDHLRDHVACLWVRTPADRRAGPAPAAPELVVPDGCTDIMSFGAQLVVAGPDDRPVAMSPDMETAIVGIRFRPGRAVALGVPLGELRNRRVMLADVWSTDTKPLEAELAGATVGSQLATLAHAATQRIRSAPDVDPLVAEVVRRLEVGDRPAVATLADELGVSERQLRRRTTDALGYGPTTFARIVRFQRALDLVRSGDALAEVAATTGFADQAHLTRDLRALAGRTPGAIARDAA